MPAPTTIRTKDIPKDETPDFYHREFKLPFANQSLPNGIEEVQKGGEVVAIVDTRGNGILDIYGIHEGTMWRFEF